MQDRGISHEVLNPGNLPLNGSRRGRSHHSELGRNFQLGQHHVALIFSWVRFMELEVVPGTGSWCSEFDRRGMYIEGVPSQ